MKISEKSMVFLSLLSFLMALGSEHNSVRHEKECACIILKQVVDIYCQ